MQSGSEFPDPVPGRYPCQVLKEAHGAREIRRRFLWPWLHPLVSVLALPPCAHLTHTVAHFYVTGAQYKLKLAPSRSPTTPGIFRRSPALPLLRAAPDRSVRLRLDDRASALCAERWSSQLRLTPAATSATMAANISVSFDWRRRRAGIPAELPEPGLRERPCFSAFSASGVPFYTVMDEYSPCRRRRDCRDDAAGGYVVPRGLLRRSIVSGWGCDRIRRGQQYGTAFAGHQQPTSKRERYSVNVLPGRL